MYSRLINPPAPFVHSLGAFGGIKRNIMKTLNKYIKTFSSDINVELKTLTFKSNGIRLKRKGFAIIGFDPSRTNKRELITFEPVHYSNGDRWLIYGSLVSNYCTNFYAKNIYQAIKKLNIINQ
jgi:hypothetical protein